MLKQKLDDILGPAGGSGPSLSEGEDASGAGAALLPRAVLDSATALFTARTGYAPTSDQEALSLLRDVLHQAGIISSGTKTPLQQVIESLPPPPPPLIHINKIPSAVIRMASSLTDVGRSVPEEVRNQQQLLALKKRVGAFLAAQKLPKLVISMARAEFETDNMQGAATDLEAVEHLIYKFAEAGLSDVAPGFDGGGGARVRPPHLGGAAGKSVELPPPPAQVDMSRVPKSAARAAAALGTQVARLDAPDQISVLVSRLREHQKHVLPQQVLHEAHAEYRVAFGKPAASDREALAQLTTWIDRATCTAVRPGWDGGGGVRVIPPRPRPPLQQASGEVPPQPLALGAVPLSVVEAASGLGKKSGKNLLHAVFGGLGGLLGSGGGGDENEILARVQGEPAQMAAQLAKLRQRLEVTLERQLSLSELPQPVLTAAHDIFLARQGHAAPSEVEALRLLRDVLDDAGVRLDIVDATYGASTPLGGGGSSNQLLGGDAFKQFALGGGEGVGFEQVGQCGHSGRGVFEQVGAPGKHLSPPPLSTHVMRAAMELESYGSDGQQQGLLPVQSVTPMQLKQLHDQLDAHITSGRAADGAAGTPLGRLPPPPLPPAIELALQSEFQTRVGGNEVGEVAELHQLAKQVVQEAREAQEGARVRQAMQAMEREQSRRQLADTGSRRSLLRSMSSKGGSCRLLRSPSVGATLGSVGGGAAAPEFAAAAGFNMVVEGDDFSRGYEALGRRSCARGSIGGRSFNAGRGSVAGVPVLLERDASLHHLGSRKQLYADSVRGAVSALSRSSNMQASVQASDDAPTLLRVLSGKLEEVGKQSLGQRAVAMGRRLGQSSRRIFGRDRTSRVLPGSPQARQDLQSVAVAANATAADSTASAASTKRSKRSKESVPASQSKERPSINGGRKLEAGWEGGGGARLSVLPLQVLEDPRSSIGDASSRPSFPGGIAHVRSRGAPQSCEDVRASGRRGSGGGHPALIGADSSHYGSFRSCRASFGAVAEEDPAADRLQTSSVPLQLATTPCSTPGASPMRPVLSRQCSGSGSMRQLPPLPPLQACLYGGSARDLAAPGGMATARQQMGDPKMLPQTVPQMMPTPQMVPPQGILGLPPPPALPAHMPSHPSAMRLFPPAPPPPLPPMMRQCSSGIGMPPPQNPPLQRQLSSAPMMMMQRQPSLSGGYGVGHGEGYAAGAPGGQAPTMQRQVSFLPLQRQMMS